MPTIHELPEPSGKPAGPSVGDKPPPGTFADSGITPGGPAHIEFIGTLFGSPEPTWVESPTGYNELAPGEEFKIDWDWLRVPIKAGDHVITKMPIEGSWSINFRGEGRGSIFDDPGAQDKNPAGDIDDWIASQTGDYYYGIDGKFARNDTPYTFDIWINTTPPDDILA